MSLAYPLVVPPTRTFTLGEGLRGQRQRIGVDLNTQTLADVRRAVRNITLEETAQQIRLGNPPQVVEVDGKTNKDIDAVDKKAVVLFGTVLAQVAMKLVEMELAAAIDRATTARTGRLRSVTSTWQWLYGRKGRAAQPVTSGAPLPAFAPGDWLVLVPKGVPHATMTNRNVARANKLAVAAKKGRRVAKSQQNVGFLATATAALRRKALFKQFAVVAEFTKTHMVPGELMTRTQGTGYIKIRPRFRRMKV
jgi:hypothetical protein